jgi:hypothetical protein
VFTQVVERMMHKKTATPIAVPAGISLLLGMSACADISRSIVNDTTVPDAGLSRAIGTVELPVAGGFAALQPQVLTSGAGKLLFGSPTTSVIDDVGSHVRVINVRFPVTNASTNPMSNISLVAMAKQGRSLAGTAINSIWNAATPTPAAITDGNIAQDIKPGHAVTTGFAHDDANADFQVFSSSEIAQFQQTLRSTNTIGANDVLLQYGFVVRAGNKRTLNPNETGSVTVSMRVPKTSAAFEPKQTRVTRSLDESLTNAVNRAAAISDKTEPVQMMVIGEDGNISCGFSCTTTTIMRVETATGSSSAAKNAVFGNRVSYAGGSGEERFNDVVVLSDQSILIAGEASDGKTILNLYQLPKVRDVFRIRTTNKPGQATGDIYISGSRDGASPSSDDGYYIAKLNNNFVNGAPTALSWLYNVVASGDHKEAGSSGNGGQTWDVGGDGKVVYAMGTPFNPNWAAMYRLKADGTQDTVANWRAHWGASGEFDGLLQDYPGGAANASYSGLVMKAQRKGSLRSTTAADYALLQSDGNGSSTRQGKWPDDYYFKGHCDFLTPNGSMLDCNNIGGPGYTGYRRGGNPTQRVGGIAINRDNNDIYVGYSTQSVLPDGNPDFEPAVVGFSSNGSLKWWSRLYTEHTSNSSPDQYVDGLAIDHTNSQLVVLARSHGNNTYNLWNTSGAFKQSFSGTNGNIHISWLGKLALGDGALATSTWVAEWDNSVNTASLTVSADPNLDGWPSPNAGWTNLNTTRVFDVNVDAEGKVYVVGVGRRSITTRQAFQKMLKSNVGNSSWNNFVRVYSSDLNTALYSSVVSGPWDAATQVGGDNIQLHGVFPGNGGVLVAGYHKLSSGVAKGNPAPTTNIPSWGRKTPVLEDGYFGFFRFE